MHSKLHNTYLPEFMWRRQFGGLLAFASVLKHISEHVCSCHSLLSYLTSDLREIEIGILVFGRVFQKR